MAVENVLVSFYRRADPQVACREASHLDVIEVTDLYKTAKTKQNKAKATLSVTVEEKSTKTLHTTNLDEAKCQKEKKTYDDLMINKGTKGFLGHSFHVGLKILNRVDIRYVSTAFVGASAIGAILLYI